MQEILVPRMKPAAADTWEIRASLSNDDDESERVPLEFPRPYVIVGAHVTVIQTTNAGNLLVPTADDILALLDLDNQRRFTAAEIDSGAGVAAQYVTASALDTEFRDLNLVLDAPRPELGLSFRWKGTKALYEDCLISVAFFCTPLEGK